MPTDTQQEELNDAIDLDNKSPNNDFDRARESIHVDRFDTSVAGKQQGWKWLKKLKESFLLSCTLITSLVAVTGLFFTILQFDKTMKIQRHTSAEAAVGQFISQVTELVTQETALTNAKGQSNRVLEGFIVSRAQMLIDGEETGRFAGDILRFLAANEFGQLIGRGPGTDDRPTLSVRGLVLVDAKIAHATVEEGNLSCMGFEQGVFDNVKINGGSFQFIKLNQAKFLSVGFEGSLIEAIDFSNTRFSGINSFRNASLKNVRFSGSQLFRQNLVFDGATIINSDFSDVGSEEALKEKSDAYRTLEEHDRLAEFRYLDKLDRSSIDSIAIDSALLEKIIKLTESRNIVELEQLLTPDKLISLVHWIEVDNLAKQLSKAKSLKGTRFSLPLKIALQRRVNENMLASEHESQSSKNIYSIDTFERGSEFSENLHDELNSNNVNPETLNLNHTWDWVWKDHCPDEQRRDRSLNIMPSDSPGSLLAFF